MCKIKLIIFEPINCSENKQKKRTTISLGHWKEVNGLGSKYIRIHVENDLSTSTAKCIGLSRENVQSKWFFLKYLFVTAVRQTN